MGSIETKIMLDGAQFDKIIRSLSRLRELGGRPKQMMKKLGAGMVRIVGKNFEAEGRPTRWKARSRLSDVNLGRQAMERTSKTKAFGKAKERGRFRMLRRSALKAMGNKILSLSGELKNSIYYEAEDQQVSVGPSGAVPYARFLHYGGIIRAKGKALAIPFGNRILRVQKVVIPARPYLVIPNSEFKVLNQIALGELKEAAGVD